MLVKSSQFAGTSKATASSCQTLEDRPPSIDFKYGPFGSLWRKAEFAMVRRHFRAGVRSMTANII